MAGFRLGMGMRGFDVARRRFGRAGQSVLRRQWIAVKRAALLAERELKKGLKSGSPGGKKFLPLGPVTTALRKGKKPLIDTASLLGSITTTLDEKNKAAFVGVHRTRRGPGGEDIVNIAVAHEFGTGPFEIRVTDRMRKLFIFLFIKTGGAIKPLSASTTTITHPGIPARPFIRPVIDMIRPQLQLVLARAYTEGGGVI